VIVEAFPAKGIAILINQNHVDTKPVFMESNQLDFMDFMTAGSDTEHGKLLTLEK